MLPVKRLKIHHTHILLVLWLVALGVGMFILLHYATTPAPIITAPAVWPSATIVPLAETKPTLVMFLHPQCACSQASLNELSKLLTKIKDKANVYALFFSPSGLPQGWERTTLWKQAVSMPGVNVIMDTDAKNTKLFHVHTSGQVLLYSPKGRLLFNGGITPARGHSGDNKGEEAIAEIIKNPSLAHLYKTSVFGCSIVHVTQKTKVNQK